MLCRCAEDVPPAVREYAESVKARLLQAGAAPRAAEAEAMERASGAAARGVDLAALRALEEAATRFNRATDAVVEFRAAQDAASWRAALATPAVALAAEREERRLAGVAARMTAAYFKARGQPAAATGETPQPPPGYALMTPLHALWRGVQDEHDAARLRELVARARAEIDVGDEVCPQRLGAA